MEYVPIITGPDGNPRHLLPHLFLPVKRGEMTRDQMRAIARVARRMEVSYRSARRSVQPAFGCDGAVAMPFAGMWLCIERDGYTHS